MPADAANADIALVSSSDGGTNPTHQSLLNNIREEPSVANNQQQPLPQLPVGIAPGEEKLFKEVPMPPEESLVSASVGSGKAVKKSRFSIRTIPKEVRGQFNRGCGVICRYVLTYLYFYSNGRCLL